MDLQIAFYVIGIIFMSLMLILLLAPVAAVFVIRTKINAIHDNIDQKLKIFTTIADKSITTVDKVKRAVGVKK